MKPYLELTFKAIVIAIILTVVLAAANTYLALKIGILPSASIPAAILSMGILRFFKHSSILENNLIQTAASAGMAVVGGIVYTAPSLIIIHYWFNFPYLQNFLLALIGGVLGVLFSIPIRKRLVTDNMLSFPEGKAIAAVLKSSQKDGQKTTKFIIWGGLIGAVIDLFQSGFKLLSDEIQFWTIKGHSIFGFGVGFSAAMIGTGYLIGIDIGASLMFGGILSWVIGMPILSHFLPFSQTGTTNEVAMQFWSQQFRYVSIGAMLLAGIISLLAFLRPSISKSLELIKSIPEKQEGKHKDFPFTIILSGILICLIATYYIFQINFPLLGKHLSCLHSQFILLFILIYITIIGFIFSAICGYFSGLLGVSGSPGSGIIISGALLIAVLFKAIVSILPQANISMLEIQAIVIFITAIIACISAIACDNIQDLKVGHILGATPWKQQLMLLLGILISALIIPIVMQLLFDVYGLAGSPLKVGQDPNAVLAAPPAAMIASLTGAAFNNQIPWHLMGWGALVIVTILIFHRLFFKSIHFSILAIATGMYLPISTTIPLFIGSLLGASIKNKLNHQSKISKNRKEQQYEKGFLIASGLLCGAALMEILLSAIFAYYKNINILSVSFNQNIFLNASLSTLVTILLIMWIRKMTLKK